MLYSPPQRGPNKVPLYSMGVVATVTIAFILVGDINTLAPIVTMPFLLTYACIDYSYFALAQTFDIQMKREERFRIQAQSPSYESRRYGATTDHDNDLDHLFPERTRHKNLSGVSDSHHHHHHHSSAQNLMYLTHYFHKATNSNAASAANQVPSSNPLLPNPASNADGGSHPTDENAHPDRVTFRGTARDNAPASAASATNTTDTPAPTNEEDDSIAQPIAPIPIHSKTKNWYSVYCNRWASLFGAIVKVTIMLLVNWYYAISSIAVVFLIWFYVGTANPAVKPGLAAEFRLFVWFRSVVFRCFG